MTVAIPIRCEQCRRALSDGQIADSKYKRLYIQAADHSPLYTIILCDKCANDTIKAIYHRQMAEE